MLTKQRQTYIWDNPFTEYAKLAKKAKNSCPLIWTYQGIKNISFLENFAYILNG